tara:strand:- start:525 stop:1445 length:921 start_codon:yes stop_codon:yes gene_type:complete
MSEMKKAPLVSVIVNCHNGEQYLKQALDSIYKQDYSNFEIIFWDNQSTDGSRKVTLEYDNRLKYHLASEHSGLGAARDSAIQEANGEYICFLDVDDLFAEGRLREQVAFMQLNRLKFSYGSYVEIDKHGASRKRHVVKQVIGNRLEEHLLRYTICMHTVMLRRELFELDWCFFDHNLLHSPDANLFYKILAKYPVGSINNVLAFYRIHDKQMTKKMLSVIGREAKFNIDSLVALFPETIIKYKSSIDWAYAKVHFYDAIAYVQQEDYRLAMLKIRLITNKSIYFKLLYILIIFRVPSHLILKVLSR